MDTKAIRMSLDREGGREDWEDREDREVGIGLAAARVSLIPWYQGISVQLVTRSVRHLSGADG